MGCNCNGTSAAKTAGATVAVWTIQLPNGTKAGSYPTQEAAEQINRRSFAGKGTVVAK